MLGEFLGEGVPEYIRKVVVFCWYVRHIWQGHGAGHTTDARCSRLEGILLSSIFSTCSNKSGHGDDRYLGCNHCRKGRDGRVGIDRLIWWWSLSGSRSWLGSRSWNRNRSWTRNVCAVRCSCIRNRRSACRRRNTW